MASGTNSIVGSVRSTDLEANLRNTIMGKYITNIDDFIGRSLSETSDGCNVRIPDLGILLETIPTLGNDFRRKYNGVMGLEEGVQNIPDEVAIPQGALFDGLCWGYDTETQSYALYTMNLALLNYMTVGNKDLLTKVMEKNKKGLLKCYRIDVEYTMSPEQFTFTAVNHRKDIDNETVVLIPYYATVRWMALIETLLMGRGLLACTQRYNNAEKTRVITKDEKVLAKYSGDMTMSKEAAVSSSYFPLRGFFYAPVVGAPVTSAMVTNINIFNLDLIKKVSASQLGKYGIEYDPNPMETYAQSSVMVNYLMQLLNDDPEEFNRVLNGFPRVGQFITSTEDISDAEIFGYLHSIKRNEFAQIVENMPAEIQNTMYERSLLLGEMHPFSEGDWVNLRSTLDRNVCKFLIRKKDCKLSTIIGTNNQAILAKVYGKGYQRVYEGFNYRFVSMMAYLKANKGKALDWGTIFYGYGFTKTKKIPRELGLEVLSLANTRGYLESDKVPEDISSTLKDEVNWVGALEDNDFVTDLKSILAEFCEVRLKASAETNNILVRTLDAYKTEKGVKEFYKYLDPEKVIDAYIIVPKE